MDTSSADMEPTLFGVGRSIADKVSHIENRLGIAAFGEEKPSERGKSLSVGLIGLYELLSGSHDRLVKIAEALEKVGQ